MGQVNDIVTSEEFLKKSPLERAQARADLFAIAIRDNPQLGKAMSAADSDGRQKIYNGFSENLAKRYPDAFSTRGYSFVRTQSATKAQEDKSPVYDLATERFLRMAAPPEARMTSGEPEYEEAAREFKTRYPDAKSPIFESDGARQKRENEQSKAWNEFLKPYSERRDKRRGEENTRATEEANQDYAALRENLTPDQLRKLAPLVYSRYASAGVPKDIFGEETDFVPVSKEGPTTGEMVAAGALRVAPPLAAHILTGGKSMGTVAAAGAMGETLAENLEIMQGHRERFSPAEIGLNSVLSVIPARAAQNILNPAMRTIATAGLRGGEGAAQGVLYEGGRQLLEGEKADLGRVGLVAAAGFSLGALLGGIEGRFASRLVGKSVAQASEELPGLIKGAKSQEERAAYEEMQRRILAAEKQAQQQAAAREVADANLVTQRRIEDAVGVGQEVRSAEDAAQTLENAASARERVSRSPAARDLLREQLGAEEALGAAKLADVEQRSVDFKKARAEELQGEIRARQLKGEESVTLAPRPENRLGIKEVNGLAPEHADVERRFSDELNRRTDAENDALYDALPDAMGGRVFNSNTAQELSPDFVANRRANNEATLGGGRAYVRERFQRELQRVKDAGTGPDTAVIFTAGGQGSGKSSFIKSQVKGAQKSGVNALVFDGTMQDRDAAEQLIKNAVESGASVHVSYIHTPIETAMKRNVGRGKRHGGNNREVSPENLGRGHYLAQKNFIELSESPQLRDAGVEFSVQNNSIDGGDVTLAGNGVDFLKDKGVLYADEQSTLTRARKAHEQVAGSPHGGTAAREGEGLAGQQGAAGGNRAIDSGSGGEGQVGRDTQLGRSELSPQAQRVAEEDAFRGIGGTGNRRAGFVNPSVVTTLGGATAGGVTGFATAEDGTPLEERIQRGLAGAVLGAGGGYWLGKSFLRGAAPHDVAASAGKITPKERGELAFWRKVREQGAEEAKAPLLTRVREGANTFRQKMGNRFASLDRIDGAIERAGGTSRAAGDVRLSQVFQNTRGASGKAQADVWDFMDNVVAKIPEGDRGAFEDLLNMKRAGQRIRQDMADDVERARIMAMDEGARTAEERVFLKTPAGRRRVAGKSLEDIDAGLAALRKELGDKKFSQYDQLAAGEFQQEADKALGVLVDAGVISKEQHAAIRASNDFYSPYRVIHEAELNTYGGGRAGDKIPVPDNTIKMMSGIDDPDFKLESPLGVMAEKIFGARVVAERNIAMRRLAQRAGQGGSEPFVRKLSAGQNAPAGMAAVPYFENGVKQRLAVDEKIVEFIAGLNDVQAGIALNALRGMNRVFRAGATGLKLPFMVVNAPRDVFRSASMSQYGLGRGGANNSLAESARMPADFVHALYASMFGPRTAARSAGAVLGGTAGFFSGDGMEDKLERGALGAAAGFAGGAAARKVAGALGKHVDALDAEKLYRDFYRSGAAGSVVMEGLENQAQRGTAAKLMSPGRGVINSLADLSKSLEEVTKIATWKRGMRQEGLVGDATKKLSPSEYARRMDRVVSEVRNYGGSPDFDKSGTVMRELNMVVPFLNARLQGTGQDLARLAGRDGAKAAAQSWAVLGTSVGLASVGLWYLNQRPENAKDFKDVPDWEKRGYAMIPRYDDKGEPLYFTNEQGQQKREYWRVPLTETYGNLSRSVTAAMDYAKEHDPDKLRQFGEAFTEEVLPFNISGRDARERVESVIGGSGPAATIPYTLATGREPGLHRDLYRNNYEKEAPESVSRPTTPEPYNKLGAALPQWVDARLRSPVMLESITNQATGGFPQQFITKKPIAGRDENTNRAAVNPLTSRFVGSQQVAGDRVVERVAADEKHAEAVAKVAEGREVDALVDELMNAPDDRVAELASQVEANPALAKAVMSRMKSRQMEPEVRAIKALGVSSGARARAITKALLEMDDDRAADFIEALKGEGVLTQAVEDQVTEMIAR